MRTNEEQRHSVGPVARWTSGRDAAEIGTVFCIGRNYADHAKELGNALPDEPMVFLKSRNSVAFSGSKIAVPAWSKDLHYEGEMVLLIGGEGASPRITGVGIGIDFTLRDVQGEVKKKGHPWTKAKSFKGAALISDFYDLDTHQPDKGDGDLDLSALRIRTLKNGHTVQDGGTSDMIFDCGSILGFISESYGLLPGDIIFTGTPEGVGELKPKDSVVSQLWAGEKMLCQTQASIR